jgi:3-dehydroquinate dehydratase I
MTTSAQTTAIGDVILGEGMPKICVPITARDLGALRVDAEALAAAREVWDVVELRVDHLDLDAVPPDDALGTVRDALPDAPLLFTFRTRPEGGERDIAAADHEALLLAAIGSGRVDAVDVELFSDRDALHRVVGAAHAAGVPVVMSSHDFAATPDREEIVARLTAQQDLGADVVKIAVMPNDAADVVTLLEATLAYSSTVGARPAITMAMGGLGVVSRLAGETFGSALTFGTVGRASAPGQVDARALREVLALVHAAG